MIQIHGDMLSGNCYKIALLCALLDIEYAWHHVDILHGGARSAEFSRMNPNQKVPLLVLDDGECLWESNAILNYLAEGTDYVPSSRLQKARVLQWQFFEQYSHEPYIAVARFIQLFLGLPVERRAEYESKQAGGHKALAVMEQHLGKNAYFVADRATIADVSLFAYTHVAHEGGFDTAPYPCIQAWIARIQALPGFIPMQRGA